MRKVASFIGCGCATVFVVLLVVVVFVIDRSGPDETARDGVDAAFAERIERATDPQLEAVNETLDEEITLDAAVALRSSFHESAYWVGGTVPRDDNAPVHGVWLLFGNALFVNQVWAANPPATEVSAAPSWRGSEYWAGFHQNEIGPLERYVRQRAEE